MRQQPKDTPYITVVELFKERHELFSIYIKGTSKPKRQFA